MRDRPFSSLFPLDRVQSCLRATVHRPIIQPLCSPVRMAVSPCKPTLLSTVGRAHAIRFIDTILARSPEGWWNASISSYMQTSASRLSKMGYCMKNRRIPISRSQLWNQTVNFSSVPCFALFTRVRVFPSVPLFNSPMDMLSVRHKNTTGSSSLSRVKVFVGVPLLLSCLVLLFSPAVLFFFFFLRVLQNIV